MCLIKLNKDFKLVSSFLGFQKIIHLSQKPHYVLNYSGKFMKEILIVEHKYKIKRG